MRHLIAGTAGHIDHGKTALVRALTGIDTDRLEEEKRRGISIDIGFAHLELNPELRVGFVDVPGHERFIRNMLAGVGGIDMVLLVIAADESIKPQTREHFEICRLLGISHGIVVITKADLVDREIVDLVRLETEEFVAGSFLAGAPVVPVSAVTGAGLDELRRQMTALAARVPAKDATRYFRLPIDRAFAMRGFGAVVTGTLIAGSVAAEQEVEVHPLSRRVRVRGLQVHGSPVERAFAGQRTAVNLSGIEHAELARGMTLAEAGRFGATRTIDCALELLASAKPLKPRAPVHFHAGTSEIEAVAVPLGADLVKPGESGYVRLLLREPTLLLPGDRFIIRMFSPVVTIGGGVVLDNAPPRRRAEAAARLKILAEGSPAARIHQLVRESKYGVSLQDLAQRTGLVEAEIEKTARDGKILLYREPQTWLADRAAIAATVDRISGVLEAFHRRHPLQPGQAKEELRSKEMPGAPPFLFDALLASSKSIAVEGEHVRLASHKLALKGDEEQALAKIESAFRDAGLTVPAAQEVLARCGVDPARARSLLQILLRNKKIARVAEDLIFHQSALQSLRAMLAERKGQRFSVPEFKDWTGVSRKYAIPLLEFLDRERVTRRDGDARLVL